MWRADKDRKETRMRMSTSSKPSQQGCRPNPGCLPRPPRPAVLGDAGWLRDTYGTEGRSVDQIAAQLDVAPPVVRAAMDTLGIPVRTPPFVVARPGGTDGRVA